MALDVGVNVIEVDGRSAPTLVAAPTSVGAFIGLTERGVPDSPVRISSLADFERRFGNYRSSRFGVTAEDGYLGYAVEGFFRNGGRAGVDQPRGRSGQHAGDRDAEQPGDGRGGGAARGGRLPR